MQTPRLFGEPVNIGEVAWVPGPHCRCAAAPLRGITWLPLALGLAALPVWGIRLPDKPPPQDFFVDRANLIAPTQREAINATAASLLRDQQIPIFVVTIGSLSEMDAAGSTVDQYAKALFDHWGIGSQRRNFGALLLVSLGDRKARIELGEGWKHDRDAQAANIMDSLIVPAFKRGDYSVGIADGVRGLDAMARGANLPRPTAPWWYWPAVLLGGVFVVTTIINLFRSGRSGWAWALIAGVVAFLFLVLRNAGQSSGSSGGFGGGSSGGGGASGSW